MSHLQIYEAYRPTLARAYSEDAAQEAGIQLVTHPPLAIDPPQVRKWLNRVASRAWAHEQYRRPWRVEDPTDVNDPSTGAFVRLVTDPRKQIDARLELQELRRKGLPKGLEALLLKETSLNQTERSRLRRCRLKLREGEHVK